MPTLAQTLSAIDAFMGAPKALIGVTRRIEWQPSLQPNELQLRLPLEVGGQLPGAQLAVIGRPTERKLWFRLGIIFGGMICRLDYTDETHANPVRFGAGLQSLVRGPHYHSWPLNRSSFRGFTKAAKLHVAAPHELEARTFDAHLRWFCTDTNIESLPANHTIELPKSDTLL